MPIHLTIGFEKPKTNKNKIIKSNKKIGKKYFIIYDLKSLTPIAANICFTIFINLKLNQNHTEKGRALSPSL